MLFDKLDELINALISSSSLSKSINKLDELINALCR
jgi:hypothetical protein